MREAARAASPTRVEGRRVTRVYHSAVVTAWRRRDAELRKLGVALTTVAPLRWNEGGKDVSLTPEPGEPVVGVRTFGRHPYRFVFAPVDLARALRRSRPEVLDIHEEPASLAALQVYATARLLGLRPSFCLYSAQNLPKRYPPPFRWGERFLLRRAAAVHTCNDAAGSVLRGKGFSGALLNLGLGVDPSRFAAAAAARGDAPTEPQAPLRVGYVGRLTAQKGVEVLVRALAQTPRAVLTIIGGGPDEAVLRRLVDELGLHDRVRFAGHVDADELPDRLAALDVVAVPSLDTAGVVEQFGRVVVEAQAAGAAVLVSDSGELATVGGRVAVVVPQGDVGAWAAALDRLATHPEECRSLQEGGPGQAARYSWERIAERQQLLYEEMLGR